MAAGDVSLRGTTSVKPAGVLNDTRDMWDAVDARVANLESVCTSRREPAARIGASVRAEPAVTDFLAEAGLTAVTVANNHALDYGSDGLIESVERLTQHGIQVCGVSQAAGKQAPPALFRVKNVRVGMLGFTDNYRPPASEQVHAMPATAAADRMIADIKALAPEVDFVIVQVHWGYEFALHPLRRHRDLARRLAAAGADLVLCHHAHVPMGVEVAGRSVIAHGLGNSLSQVGPYVRGGHDWTMQTFLLKVSFSRKGVHSAEVVPCELGDGPSIRLLRGMRRALMLGAIGRMSRRLNDTAWLDRVERSRTIFEGHRLADHISCVSEAHVADWALQLRTPIHRELVCALRAIDAPPTRFVARFLSGLADAAGDGCALARMNDERQSAALQEALAGLRRLFRWQDAFLSRLP